MRVDKNRNFIGLEINMEDTSFFSKNKEEFIGWRKHLHSLPELSHDEKMTSEFIAEKLESFGLDVARRVGGFGVVATLKKGVSKKSIGLRADMDALPIEEKNSFSHKSKVTGVMHACGHDGHTVMLLAAAKYLALSNSLDGTVYFIFQPAEEANEKGSGAKAMIDDGLFSRFPMDCIYSMHNAPNYQARKIALLSGAIMASVDRFEVTIKGRGTHAAFPNTGRDPLTVMVQLFSAWQSIVNREVNPVDGAVLSVTGVKTADSWSVIPDYVSIKGTVRTLCSNNRALIRERFDQTTKAIAKAFRCDVEIDYEAKIPVTYNSAQEVKFASDIAKGLVGEANVFTAPKPVMGAEDFSYMLEKKPGCYFWIGSTEPAACQLDSDNSEVSEDQDQFVAASYCMVHDSQYDFNDEIIVTGASMFSRLSEAYLAK